MFEWNENFSVGIKKIDNQHQKLLSIGSELVTVLDNTAEGFDQYDEIKKLLNELFDYTVYHFSIEEKMMEEHNFIGLPAHRFEHKIFIKKLEDIDPEELDTNQNEATMNLLNFVASWITNHILEIDQKYAPYLSEKETQ